MSKMGRYCKAYPVTALQDFSGWAENYRETQMVERPESGNRATGEADGAADDDYLFLQENLTVTKGIFLDEGVVFDNVTPEWIDFCKNTLNFEVPADIPAADDDESVVSGNGQP